ncbi:arsenate reductase [Kordiimonas sediminis]|uniref:Arsenate reductase n=1 Tax=Kordiimonas sediminis TaxID=1735581 RepID=A0A919E6R4_9PROT|nr:low molecular weight phosphatase family protein [Kordiimonas sediminis]GHF17723.1 arsenate reductase [Kordiimonas sediminis]
MGATEPKKLRSILFACNQNAVRSPMAEALATRFFKRRVFVDSAGLVAGTLDGFSVAAMQELNIDISDHEAKTLQDIRIDDFDMIVALTPESRDKIQELVADKDIRVDYWLTPDPAEAEGNRNQVLDSYRLVRDRLECRIADAFANT